MPFPFAPLLAALVATAIGVVVGLPALRTARPHARRGDPGARLRHRGGVVPQQPTSSPSSGARVTPPSLFGIDLGIGAGQEFPRIEFGLVCLVTLVLVALGVAALRRSTLGSAMLAVRANERSAAGRRRQRRAGQGRSASPSPRSSPASAAACSPTGGASSRSTRSPPSAASRCCRPPTWPASRRCGAASSPASWPPAGIVFIALDRWVDLGEWFQVISGVLLIVTLITNPEGLAGAGHELADRWARWQAGAPSRRRRGRAPGGRRGRAAGRRRRAESPRAVEPAASAPAGRAPHRALRRRRRRQRRVAAGRPRQDRRAHRAERRRQDERDRRHHRLRPRRRGPSSSPGGASTRSPRTPGCAPAWPARSSRSSSTTTSPSRRTSAWRRSAVARPTAAPPSPGRSTSVGIADAARPPGGRAEPGRAPARVDRPGLRRRPGGAAARRARRRPRHRARARGSASASAPSARRGTAMLLVDHDVDLVLSVCDHVYVLDFGAVIAEGPPDADPGRPGGRRRLPRHDARHRGGDGMTERDAAVAAPDEPEARPSGSSAGASRGGRGATVVFRDLDLDVQAGQRARPARPERRRQDDAAAHAGRAAPGARRHRRASTGSRCATATPWLPTAPASCSSPTTGRCSRR